MNKVGELPRQDDDWSARRGGAGDADADTVNMALVVVFYALLGGGQRDASWDYSAGPRNRLAILPANHYDILASPLLAPAVTPFPDGSLPGPS